jgi:hypothetical protein
MSPVQSRARTPVHFAIDDEADYFLPQSVSENRRPSNVSDAVKQHTRRKSGSSTTSSASAGLT